MKRIDLVKYGFVRTPEADFSDDGNRFTCYKAGRVRVSKLISDGNVYFYGRIDGNKLIRDEYSILPHYAAMSALNGVEVSSITDAVLKNFYQDCIAYAAEYTKAEEASVMPTYEEVLAAREQIKDARAKEYASIVSKVTLPMVCSLNTYDITSFRNYFSCLREEACVDAKCTAERILGTSYSKTLTTPSHIERECKPSFNYRQLLELINKMK